MVIVKESVTLYHDEQCEFQITINVGINIAFELNAGIIVGTPISALVLVLDLNLEDSLLQLIF